MVAKDMELKDVILSTLAEMEEDTTPKHSVKAAKESAKEAPLVKTKEHRQQDVRSDVSMKSELAYLNSIRERLLVLFEGFQAPNNKNIEAKVDMTLNFLEYMLATIDDRVEKLERGKVKR